MKPPRTLIAGPHVYKVVVDYQGLIGDAGNCGHTSRDRGVIALDGDQSPTQMADTLCHEFFGHALLGELGLDSETEERICCRIGPGILEALLDNPELYAYLTASKETQ